MSVLIAWLLAHEAVLAGLGVAILDLVFALVPSLQANGILHQVYLWIKGLLPQPKA